MDPSQLMQMLGGGAGGPGGGAGGAEAGGMGGLGGVNPLVGFLLLMAGQGMTLLPKLIRTVMDAQQQSQGAQQPGALPTPANTPPQTPQQPGMPGQGGMPPGADPTQMLLQMAQQQQQASPYRSVL